MTEQEYQAHQQHMIDCAREANYQLWNTILSINGILVGVFSSVAIFKPETKLPLMLVIVLSILACVGVVMNILFTRKVYRLIGSRKPQELNEAQVRSDFSNVQRWTTWCGYREQACYYIFLAQGIVILLMIYFKDS